MERRRGMSEHTVREYIVREVWYPGAVKQELVGELVRCKDCKWGEEKFGNIECNVDMNVPPEYHGYEWFCPNGERGEAGNG